MTDDGGGVRHQQGNAADHQYPDRHHQHAGDHPLHLGDAEPFAQIGGGAPHHQAAQEHGQQHEQHHAVDAGTDAAEHHFTQQHVDHGDHAGEGGEAVVHGVDRAVGGGGGRHFPDAGQHGAEATLLAFPVAGFAGEVGEGGIRLQLLADGEAEPQHQHDGHGDEDGAAVGQILHVATQGADHGGGQRQQGDHLQPVGEGGRVLERMGRVDAEEAAAVGAELLDGDLGGGRAERQQLLLTFQGVERQVGRQALGHPLPDQQQRQDQRHRQQHVETETHQILPEVAKVGGLLAGDAAKQGDGDGGAGGGGDEVLGGEPHHLAEVGEAGFAGVGLPVGVGHEADRGVEGELPVQPGQLLRVEGQQPLRHQDQEQQAETGAVESQQAEGVGLPVLLAPVRAAAGQGGALKRGQPATLAFKHPIQVVAKQRRRQQHQQHERDGIDDLLPHIRFLTHECARGRAADSPRGRGPAADIANS